MSPRIADTAAVAARIATGADPADQPPAPQFPTPLDVPPRVTLVNGSFEEPKIAGGNRMLHDASEPGADSVPGWLTTASDRVIEIWHSRKGVPAAHGEQFAELNANEPAALYQDLETTPGTTLYWSLRHRGREGDDTMSVKIGRPGRKPNKTWTFTDGTAEWVPHADSYKVPAGQTVTRFAFEAGGTATGDPTVGNFLDDVVFGTAPSVVVTTAAEPESGAAVGGTITYTVNLKNHGGIPAENLILCGTVPAGTSYVPGSLRLEEGPGQNSGNGWYDSTTGRLTLPLGQGATAAQGGTLPSTVESPDGITAQFTVQVERDGAGRTLSHQATATYAGARGDAVEQLTSTSNTIYVTVDPVTDAEAAELTVTIVADPPYAAVGEDITFHLAVSNPGPAQATSVVVSVRLPADLELVSAEGARSFDPATGRLAIEALPAGSTAELQLRTTATAPGALSCTATVTADLPGEPARTGHGTATASVAVCPHARNACAAADRQSGGPVPCVCRLGCACGRHEQPGQTHSVLFPATTPHRWHGKKGSKKRDRHHRRFLRELALQVQTLSRQLIEMREER
ncbi:DUF11 domain-containing protein [Actinomadura sp. K4S16]|uniref:DUF11 domain-containing protein n=1 Tax=Actinomadura sp. K4S16 TaxID=1316147 RepID=UPI0011EEF2DC|nr:DUF11 domain-containing protein [Actinomadura sp. K4S16]